MTRPQRPLRLRIKRYPTVVLRSRVIPSTVDVERYDRTLRCWFPAVSCADAGAADRAAVALLTGGEVCRDR